MENKLSYKGFLGSVHFSSDDRVYFGKIKGINDLVSFEGTAIDELEEAFKYMVEEHIQDCDRQEKLCDTPC
jgi:predicted HicB family RNase H-like nuclease